MQLTASRFDFFNFPQLNTNFQVNGGKPCKIEGFILSNGQASNDAVFILSTIAGVGQSGTNNAVALASVTIAQINVLAGDQAIVPIAYFADKGIQIQVNQATCTATFFTNSAGS